MKLVLLIIDGVSDDPILDLGGRTPLEACFAPHIHYVASRGQIGRINTAFEGFPVESMVCIMGLMGYPPSQYYPAGRASFEAMAKGIPLSTGDLIFRCNTVTVDRETQELRDFTAGMISDSDARKIISKLKLPHTSWEVYPGQSYRNILIVRGAGLDPKQVMCMPPHQHIGRKVTEMLPTSSEPGAEGLMGELGSFLLDTQEQIGGMNLPDDCAANMLWLWSPSCKAEWPTFRERTNLRSGFIGGLDFLHGLAMAANIHFDVIPGATGYTDTDYAAKARYALDYIDRYDFVLVHVNAADEAGHQKDHAAKMLAIEETDRLILGPILAKLQRDYPGDFRLALCGDHKTRCSDGRHLGDPVPYAMFGAGVESSGTHDFGETACEPFEPVSSLGFLPDVMMP